MADLTIATVLESIWELERDKLGLKSDSVLINNGHEFAMKIIDYSESPWKERDEAYLNIVAHTLSFCNERKYPYYRKIKRSISRNKWKEVYVIVFFIYLGEFESNQMQSIFSSESLVEVILGAAKTFDIINQQQLESLVSSQLNGTYSNDRVALLYKILKVLDTILYLD